jgi:hypothetical protein
VEGPINDPVKALEYETFVVGEDTTTLPTITCKADPPDPPPPPPAAQDWPVVVNWLDPFVWTHWFGGRPVAVTEFAVNAPEKIPDPATSVPAVKFCTVPDET